VNTRLLRWWIFLVLAGLVGAPGRPAGAQEAEIPVLEDRLAALEEEIAARREVMDEARKAHAKRLDERRAAREALAERMLETAEAQATLEGRAAALEQRREAVEGELETLREAARRFLQSARSGGERLAIYWRDRPNARVDREAVSARVTALEERAAEAALDAEAVETATWLLERMMATLEDAVRVRAVSTEIWTAAEKREPVTLLSAGHVAFAYRTEADGRWGLALASPMEASGHRWSETLAPETRQALSAALEAVQRGGRAGGGSGGGAGGGSGEAAGRALMPMDPGGRLRPGNLRGERTLVDRAREGGVVMVPLALVAVAAMLLILERCWVLYGRNSDSSELARRVVEASRAGRLEEAETLCASRRGAVARTLAACLGRRARGQAAMEDGVEAQLLIEMPRLQRSLGGIAILAAVAPLLGLLGTVTGIIQTFGVIRTFGNANPSFMAGGISEALVTTAAGLVIAVPILLIHGLLSGRVDRIVSNAEKHAAMVLSVLCHELPDAAPEEGEEA